MSDKKIYAFGGRKRSGKGELSKFMVEKYNAKVITIAKYLKNLCCELLDVDYTTLNDYKDNNTILNHKTTEEWIWVISNRTGITKQNISNEIGDYTFMNVRDILQIIGTNIIRKFNPNWHIEQMVEEIINSSEEIIVIDDLRFPNEKEVIEKLGGVCYFIIRPTFMEVSNHISETALKWYNYSAYNIIINDRDTEYLKKTFLDILNGKNVDYSQFENKYLGDNECEAKILIESMNANPHFDIDGKLKYNNEWFYNPFVNENIKQFLL